MKNAPHLVMGDALRLPFPDGAFDVLMSVCAIEHFDDSRPVVQRTYVHDVDTVAPPMVAPPVTPTTRRRVRWTCKVCKK